MFSLIINTETPIMDKEKTEMWIRKCMMQVSGPEDQNAEEKYYAAKNAIDAMNDLEKYKAAMFSLVRSEITMNIEQFKNLDIGRINIATVQLMAMYFKDMEADAIYRSYESALRYVRSQEGDNWKEVNGKLEETGRKDGANDESIH